MSLGALGHVSGAHTAQPGEGEGQGGCQEEEMGEGGQHGEGGAGRRSGTVCGVTLPPQLPTLVRSVLCQLGNRGDLVVGPQGGAYHTEGPFQDLPGGPRKGGGSSVL